MRYRTSVLLLILLLSISGASAGIVYSPKIISHYSFNTTGSMEYKDSMRRYNLTNSGGTTTASGKLGTGYYADHAGDYVNVTKPTILGGIAKASICGWMKYVSGDNINVYGNGAANKRPLEILYYNAGSSNTFYAITDTGTAQAFKYKAAVDTVANLQASYHFVCTTYDGSVSPAANRVKFYYDGSAVTMSSSGTAPTTTTTVTTTGMMGGREQSVPCTTGVGYVDEVTVFNITLTAANITWLYNSGNGRPFNVINNNFGGSETSSNPCAYSGTGNFVITNARCNITTNIVVQTGFYWNVTNSTIWIKDATVKGYKRMSFKSGWIHFT